MQNDKKIENLTKNYNFFEKCRHFWKKMKKNEKMSPKLEPKMWPKKGSKPVKNGAKKVFGVLFGPFGGQKWQMISDLVAGGQNGAKSGCPNPGGDTGLDKKGVKTPLKR